MIKVPLQCVFCKSNLTYNLENKPKYGDMVKCQNCGKMNDFDSIVKVAINKGKERIKNEAINFIKKELQKTFKNTEIKIKLK